MTRQLGMMGAAVFAALLAMDAHAQNAKDGLAATPWETLGKEPPPKVVVDPPLEEPLSRGVVVVQYRTENFRIVPEVGAAALAVSPRVGHLHVTVDNLPWHFVVADDSNTIIVAGLPAGPHQLHVELADPTHRELGGQTVKFVVPSGGAPGH
ncbi:MAG TPA: DUF6130 family protein [Caulobacteraceae bacterium]|nr:DUF6130 family protein [Caulobacteraceae bacterium]